MTIKPVRFLMTLIGTFCVAATFAKAEPDAYLRIETSAEGIALDLMGAAGSGPWLLQHSPDARGWDDLLFLEGVGTGREQPGIEIPWGALPEPAARKGFFRAVQLAAEDPFLRRFFTERTKWRLLGHDNYQYQLRQDSGMISWQGVVVVAADQVASFETIDLQPPWAEVPDIPTIDGLFERIANAIAAKAATIDVTWHPTYGFPVSCDIDFDPLIADEERGWTIGGFTPAP